MPSAITHALVGLAATRLTTGPRAPGWLYGTAAALAALPDADVIGFALGVHYRDPWGHRGATHSLLFAALVSLPLAVALTPKLAGSALRNGRALWAFLFAVLASHGVLDAFTNGGQGIEFFWPFSTERFFFPWRPIQVSPIGITRFLSERGVTVLVSEALWIWLPLGVALVVAEVLRRESRR